MSLENKKMVMFDFDGVLVNTLDFSYGIHKVKNPHFTWERFQSYADGNFHDGYNNAVKNGEHIQPDNFHDKYKDELIPLTIQDVLKSVIISISHKYILSVVSSSISQAIKDFLRKENLDEHFLDILGFDVHASKVIKIKSLLEKHNLSSNDAVFITDTLGDILEANECNVPSIGITWGLHDREKLGKGNPAVIIDDPEDLMGAIENVLK